MPRKLLRKYLPTAEQVRNTKALQVFGKRLHDHNLWHVNRRSARGAFALGIFAALLPMPMQTVVAIGLAIFFRVNIPIAFAMCWITNPFTMAPIFVICYTLGNWILDTKADMIAFEPSLKWILESMGTVGEPFLVGSLVFAFASALFLFFATDALWRLWVVISWRQRQKKRLSH